MIKLRYVFAALLLVNVSNTTVQAGPVNDVVNKFVKAMEKPLKKIKDKTGLQKLLCEKGDFLKAKITLRSFEGKLCKFGPYAALARFICEGYKDKNKKKFEDSTCGQYVQDTIGDMPGSRALGHWIWMDGRLLVSEKILCPVLDLAGGPLGAACNGAVFAVDKFNQVLKNI